MHKLSATQPRIQNTTNLQPLDQHACLAPDDSKQIGERSISLFEGNTGFAGQTGNWEQLHESDKIRSTDEYIGRL